MPRKQTGTYEIGYGRPPVAHQFKKGQSGNPKGRRKGSMSLVAEVAGELAKLVSVQENGERNRYTKLSVLAKQLVNKAAAADTRALKLLLAIMDSGEWRRREAWPPRSCSKKNLLRRSMVKFPASTQSAW
jgi:hypothetical protein